MPVKPLSKKPPLRKPLLKSTSGEDKQVGTRPTMAPSASPPLEAKTTLTTTVGGRVAMSAAGLQESKRIKVFSIPNENLIEHSENPNEQSEKTFDELVERIKRDGPDEPLIVVPQVLNGQPTGKYLITSGHHRKKANVAAGLTHSDCIIREGWDEDRVAIELITRNGLRGTMNPYKFTEIWDRLAKRYDKAQLQKMMGLTEKKAFNALYKRISDNLSPKQKRKLDEAKESINSIDDLSSVLHTIFKEHGSELEEGFMVFNYGGKKHVYIKVDDETMRKLESIQKNLTAKDANIQEYFKDLINTANAGLGNVSKKPTLVKK